MSLQKMDNLENIKNAIENMNKYNQIEVLKILSKNLCKINENKSGVYINLSFLSKETIDELAEYIEYTKQQEDSINTMEYQKDEFKNTFFIEKDNKEEMPILYNAVAK
jgi:hypothetical protein